jgi:hypothetical protein
MNTFISIVGDGQGRARRLAAILGPENPVELATLGSSDLSFDGGLTFDATDGRFYAIANRQDGWSELHRFRLTDRGPTQKVADLGGGFRGGLVRKGLDLYATARDRNGVTLLYRWREGTSPEPVAAFGTGYGCGLTLNPVDGMLYALFHREGEWTEMLRIKPGQGHEVEPLPVILGLADYGGLAYVVAEGVFYALRNRPYRDAVLTRISLRPAWTIDVWAAGAGYSASSLVPADSLRMSELMLPAVAAVGLGWPGTTLTARGESCAANFGYLLAS